MQNILARFAAIENFISTPHKEEEDDGAAAPPGWPSAGAMDFLNVSFRHRPHAPLALRDVSFSLRAGEKVGVCGPTGAGKSTLLNLLFRLGPLKGVAPSSGGTVRIDGVDIATLRLSTLRAAIAVVPQEPVVFAGTLRANITKAPLSVRIIYPKN